MVDPKQDNPTEAAAAVLREVNDAIELLAEAVDLLSLERTKARTGDERYLDLEGQYVSIEDSLRRERLALRPRLAALLGNLGRLEALRQQKQLELDQREREVYQGTPEAKEAAELERANRTEVERMVPRLAALYAAVQSQQLQAAATVDGYERAALLALADAEPEYRAARERQEQAASRLQELATALSRVYEDRGSQQRYEGAGLAFVWPKPADRTVGVTAGDIAKDYPELAPYFGIRQERSAASAVRIAAAGKKDKG